MNVRVMVLAGSVLAGAQILQGAGEVWPPTNGVPMTRWGSAVSDSQPILPEYPRPQIVREKWMNLNGLWDFAVEARSDVAPVKYEGKIRVPFPIESVLSKVNRRVDEKSKLWYRRTFEVPADWQGQRVLLHFGAVDWETTVSVNGKAAGTHQGGYDGFSFDITEALTASGPQELVVAVWDPTEAGQPQGKQSRKPGGIFYTPVTGIWQTVWLEPVPQTAIADVKLVPDVDNSMIWVTASVSGKGGELEAVVRCEGQESARATGKAGETLGIKLSKPRLWWPENPFLYDVKLKLKQGGVICDTVTSYFGLRKISVGPDAKGVTRILLNNTFVLHNGFLDQGFWPDGIYTAPSDEALRYDIEITKKLGFNMTRKHVKVEPDRWYYWCDKLGLMVWQDMPGALVRGKEIIPDWQGQFEKETQRMIQGRFNHPSIVMWVLFNEGWGLSMRKDEPEKQTEESAAFLRRVTEMARKEDPTRLINHESGAGGRDWQGKNPWDLGLGDIVDFHCYAEGKCPFPEKNRAAVIGEYGYGVSPVGAVGRNLGAVGVPGISGLVLTQLTDVENEKNGALTYDRVLKGKTSAEEIGQQMRELLSKIQFQSKKDLKQQ
jgi:beta-galactosidase/beta-glucuronidase